MQNYFLSLHEFSHNLEFQNKKKPFKMFSREASRSSVCVCVSAKLLPSKTWKSSLHSVL